MKKVASAQDLICGQLVRPSHLNDELEAIVLGWTSRCLIQERSSTSTAAATGLTIAAGSTGTAGADLIFSYA
jgi:inactivated superfamily I helicase